jgi:D-lactate dehydrogenase
MDVIFYEVFEEEEAALKKALPSSIKAKFISQTIQESSPVGAPPCSLISVRTQSIIPSDWASPGSPLKGILSRSQGYDHLVRYRRETGFKGALGYLDHYCDRAVAEQALLMIFALLRKFNQQINQFNDFSRDGLTGREINGRRLLVVGVGHIGYQIVNMAKGLRMDVKGVDIDPRFGDVEYVPLEQGLGWADIVVCALPLTDQTKGLLNYATFARGKKGGIFINISRAEIAPIADIKRLLEECILGGVGMDVYEEENLLATRLRGRKEHKGASSQIVLSLKDMPNVIFTPHNAFNTQEALERKAALSVEAMTAFFDKGTFPKTVPSE